jgi:lambda family phage portal protein
VINWIKRQFSPKRPPFKLAGRRWDASKTDRLNKAHWSPATGQTLNQDLGGQLDTLAIRAEHEASNNGLVEGVIETHTLDVVGPHGPTLIIQSNDDDYADRVEKEWEDWWTAPDVNGQLSGVDFLQLGIRMLWKRGEYLNQIVSQGGRIKGPRMRLLSVHPRRLGKGLGVPNDELITMGIQQNKTGKPLQYWIGDETPSGYSLSDATAVPAENIDHLFRITEPGQTRGVPFLASSLQAIADLRDFNIETLDAARSAARPTGYYFTKHPGLENIAVVNESVEIQRGDATALPPGYEFMQVQPQHPSAQYIDFIHDRLRELGSPVCMPLLVVLQDARDHNYSSARIDLQNYDRAISCYRAMIERRTLNRLVHLLIRELELLGILPARPDDSKVFWMWPHRPHVDPKKESDAEKTMVDNHFRPWCAAVRRENLTEDHFNAFEARTNRKRKKAGLPPVPIIAQPMNTDPPAADVDLDDDDDDDSNNNKPKANARRSGRSKRSKHR